MSIHTEQLSVDIIGAGGHYNDSHGPFIARSPLFEVTGVAEMDDIRREQARAMFGLPEEAVASSYGDLLQKSVARAAIITTGDADHLTSARQALHAGKSVLVEKPAAATREECAELPGLFDYAERNGLRYWVCHPREFDKQGPWYAASQLISNPELLEDTFGVHPIGHLLEVDHGCFYTLPAQDKSTLHTSFADDKLNHNMVSAALSLPNIAGFSGAVLLKNTQTAYDTYMETIPGDERDEPVALRMSGRRCAHKEYQGKGIYRDWVEATFEEGILRVEPAYGAVTLTYGKEVRQPRAGSTYERPFDPARLYDGMFRDINDEFARCVLDPKRPEPLTRQARLLGTAAAILMQQPDFDGMITEDAVSRL